MPDESTGIEFSALKELIKNAEQEVKTHMEKMKTKTGDESVDIVEMFDVQMAMNRLSQVSEMSTSVMTAMHSSVSSMARNVKS